MRSRGCSSIRRLAVGRRWGGLAGGARSLLRLRFLRVPVVEVGLDLASRLGDLVVIPAFGSLIGAAVVGSLLAAGLSARGLAQMNLGAVLREE